MKPALRPWMEEANWRSMRDRFISNRGATDEILAEPPMNL